MNCEQDVGYEPSLSVSVDMAEVMIIIRHSTKPVYSGGHSAWSLFELKPYINKLATAPPMEYFQKIGSKWIFVIARSRVRLERLRIGEFQIHLFFFSLLFFVLAEEAYFDMLSRLVVQESEPHVLH